MFRKIGPRMKIAYLSSSFATLSHTFMRREIAALRSLGMEIALFGIRADITQGLSDRDIEITKETTYLYPLRLGSAIFANAFFLTTRPLAYFKIFICALLNEETGPFKHLKIIYHFFVSSCMALRIKSSGAEHIHAHLLSMPATIAMYCSQLLEVPFSMTVHSATPPGFENTLALKAKFKKARFVCVVSEYSKQYFGEHFPVCKDKIYVVRCGLDLDEYAFRGSAEGGPACLAARPLAYGGQIRIVAVGRFVEKKGFGYLIEALKILKEEKVDFCATLVGDGPLRQRIERQSEDYKLKQDIIFKGSMPHNEVKNELDKSDILIAPSVTVQTGEKEGIPVVIMEAMAKGVFVIATKHSGIPEIVKHNETGILVPEKDPLAIAKAVKAVKEDATLVKNCAANARRLVLEEFDIEKIAKRKKEVFENF